MEKLKRNKKTIEIAPINEENIFWCSECRKHQEHNVRKYFEPEEPYKKFSNEFDEYGNREKGEITLIFWRGEILECPSCHSLLFRRKQKFEREAEFGLFDILPLKNSFKIYQRLLNENEDIPRIIYKTYEEAFLAFNVNMILSSVLLIRQSVNLIVLEHEIADKNDLVSSIDIGKSKNNESKALIWENLLDGFLYVQTLSNDELLEINNATRAEVKKAIRVLEIILCELYLSEIEKFELLKEAFTEFKIKGRRKR